MKKNNLIGILVSILFLSLAWQNAVAERQSLTSIQLQAESFLTNYPYQTPYPVQFKLSSLDPRLNLKACASELRIGFTRQDKISGNTSLNIRCTGPTHWNIHLPVRVDVYDDVLVSRIPLVRGQSLSSTDVKLKKTNISKLNRGYFRQINDLNNLQAKNNLAANKVLDPTNLVPRKLIKLGQKVTIVLNFNGLEVKSSGMALSAASEGQLIKVRNTGSNKIIQGIVSANGQVKVSL
jgi:flagellar basal body P-ring formation protein FlgA